MEPRQRATVSTTLRLDEETRERVRIAADRHFHGLESMLMRDAVATYLNLRDALGFDFDRRIAELTGAAELAAVS